MMQLPTLADINAAEAQLIQCKRKVRLGVDRSRAALRAAAARPSTLVIVALASGFSAFVLSYRPRASVKSVPSNPESTMGSLGSGLLRTVVSMYGARVLTLALQLGSAAQKSSGSRDNANMPRSQANL